MLRIGGLRGNHATGGLGETAAADRDAAGPEGALTKGDISGVGEGRCAPIQESSAGVGVCSRERNRAAQPTARAKRAWLASQDYWQ